MLCLSALAIVASYGTSAGSELEDAKSAAELAKAKLEQKNAEEALKQANAPPKEKPKISMESVVYGANGKTCDGVNPFVVLCRGKTECSVRVDNKLCGDPNPKPQNVATITYKCGKDPKEVVVVEGVDAILFCP